MITGRRADGPCYLFGVRQVHDLSPLSRRPLRRVEYDRLIELGMFDEDERIELLYGQLVVMSPIGTLHAWVVQELNRLLVPQLVGRAVVRIQSPVAASDVSEPEPDVAVLPKVRGSYLHEHPARALMLIEVAESSLRVDRKIKSRLYAETRVPEYWIVNLVDRVVEVYRDPGATGYRRVTRHRRGETLRLRAFPDVALPVSEFMPPRRKAKRKP